MASCSESSKYYAFEINSDNYAQPLPIAITPDAVVVWDHGSGRITSCERNYIPHPRSSGILELSDSGAIEGPESDLLTPEGYYRIKFPQWSTEWSPYSPRVGLGQNDSTNHVERVDMLPPIKIPVQQNLQLYRDSTFGGILRRGGLRIGLTASGHAIALVKGQVAAYLINGEALDWEVTDFGPGRWNTFNTVTMCPIMGTVCSIQFRDILFVSQVS